MKIMGKMIAVLIKGIIGMVAIYFVNLLTKQYDVTVGLNVFNGLAIGTLGICGFFLLYTLALLDSKLF